MKRKKIATTRKTTDGAMRNKERTMQKMVTAVGEVLKKKGYTALTANNIIAQAGVDRKLIKQYFGNLDNLIEAYITSNDYWMTKVDQSVDLQKILWEASEFQKKLRELSENREALGVYFANIINPVHSKLFSRHYGFVV